MAPGRIAERLDRSIKTLDWTAGWIDDADLVGDIRGVTADLADLKLALERETFCPAVSS